MLPPPPITTEIVECPSCAHGIDPHGTDPGGKCGVGDGTGHLCECLWSPNDIAAAHSQTARLTARITARIDAAADAAGVPRLRILPIHCRQTGDPSHYVVVDRCRQLDADRPTPNLKEGHRADTDMHTSHRHHPVQPPPHPPPPKGDDQ